MRVLKYVGEVVGFVSGLITLYGFIFTEGSLLGWFGLETFDDLAAWARSFEERWPFGPFLTAFLVYGIVAAVAFAADRWDDAADYVGTLLLLFPLAGAWIWLFSDVVSTRGLLVFVAGYSAVPWLSVFAPTAAAFGVSEWLERRRAFIGTVSNVTANPAVFLNREWIVYTLVLAREQDVPVKVTYSPWRRDERPPKRGMRVRVFGRWREGVFAASRIDALPPADARVSAEE